MVFGLLGGLADLFRISNVALNWENLHAMGFFDALLEGFETLHATGQNNKVGALLGKCACNLATKSTGGAGHNCNPIF